MQNKLTPIEKKDRRQIMAEALWYAVSLIRKGMRHNSQIARKEVAFAATHKKFPMLEVQNCELTGDNWRDNPNPMQLLYPYPTASASITQRDNKGNPLVSATMLIEGMSRRVVIADDEGLWKGEINEEMQAEFHCVTEVNSALLGLPPTAQIFGQKSSKHWVEANGVIGDLNKDNIRTGNDNGPYYLLRDLFQDDHVSESAIMPLPVAYVEPYSNKPKEELAAFYVRCLNRNLPKDQRFIITDMANQELFEGKRVKREGTNLKYAASGYLIAPTKKVHERVLTAITNSVVNRREFVTAEPGSKQRLLAEQLSRNLPQAETTTPIHLP